MRLRALGPSRYVPGRKKAKLTMLQVGSPCGLCNRLDVIITGYVLAAERGEEEIEVLWPVNNQMPASFHDLFTGLLRGRVLECNLDPSAWENNHSLAWQNYHALVASLP